VLTMRLHPYAPDLVWQWNGTGYATNRGSSEIVPYAHPLVEQLAATDGTRTLVMVRERTVGRPACDPAPRTVTAVEFDRALVEAPRWPGDYVLVETGPNLPVRVSAGARGIAPLYLAHDREVLHGSWNMADLRPFATGLCSKEVARLLVYRPRYSHQTVFTGIHRLTERSTAHFGGTLYLRYPAPALHGTPRALPRTPTFSGRSTRPSTTHCSGVRSTRRPRCSTSPGASTPPPSPLVPQRTGRTRCPPERS